MRSTSLTRCALLVAVVLAPLVPAATAQAVIQPNVYENGFHILVMHYPVISWGHIALQVPVNGNVECENLFAGHWWNEKRKETERGTETERGYALIEGWATSSCTAEKEIRSLEGGREAEIAEGKIKCHETERAIGEGKCLTVFASPEPEIAEVAQKGVVCNNETENPPCASGTEERFVISRVYRRETTLPWKGELVRGVRENGEHTDQLRIGLGEFNEGEETEIGVPKSTRCYPVNDGKANDFLNVPQGCVLGDIIYPQLPLEEQFFGTLEVTGVNGSGNGLSPTRLEFESEHSGTLESNEHIVGTLNTIHEVKVFGARGQELLQGKCSPETEC